MLFVEPIRNFYGRFERRISSWALVLGFILDAFTLKRADALFENAWIAGYLILIGIFIILIHAKENEIGGEKNPSRAHFWYVNILQFCFGGVFSAFLVLYFRSADILTAWPFIALIAIIFIANEFLKKHYLRLSFQISLFFLSIYSFTIFLVPVLLRKIGPWIFILSGIISLVCIALFLKILFYFIKDKFVQSKRLIVVLISSIFILVNFFYFTNLIPPIPLSLKDAGVYYSIQKTEEGNYLVTYEDASWINYFKLYPDFRKVAEAPVYAFSAIFSPRGLNLTIIHEWQRYDEVNRKWITERVMNLPLVGGRDGGFRTYSARSNLASGKWRVNITTEKGQKIGNIRFNVEIVETGVNLSSMVK